MPDPQPQGVLRSVMSETGLCRSPGIWRDGRFWLALLACIPVVVGLRGFGPSVSLPAQPYAQLIALSVLWAPLWEELLFRGIVQGQLLTRAWGRRRCLGVSAANGIASLAFMLSHVFYHAPLWAAAVLVPSLVFGYFRERHDSVLPAMLLHAGYNLAYLLAFSL